MEKIPMLCISSLLKDSFRLNNGLIAEVFSCYIYGECERNGTNASHIEDMHTYLQI